MLWYSFFPVNFVKLSAKNTYFEEHMLTAASILFCLRMGSHLFLNLCLAVYIHGNTMLSEYYICDRPTNAIKYEEKVS